MFAEIALAGWSAAGLAWWIVAWRLARQEPAAAEPSSAPESAPETLSIFKPLPPLGPEGLRHFEPGLESFLAQLDPSSELLLGIHEADRATVAPFLDRLRRDHPAARLQPVYRSGPDACPNPKIAWQKVLAPTAQGALWLWSDADIVAPPGFLRAARAEFARAGARMLTFPYVVRGGIAGPALLDALFVNVEFYPGVLFLRRLGPVDFGLGAAMLFRREDFSRVDGNELGAALADDFVLGQKLRPVRLGQITLATAAEAVTWCEALGHYRRWSKTVAWNRPGGAAARIVVLPLFGWIACVALHPASVWAWAGLVAMMQMDAFFAAILCRQAGVRLRVRDTWIFEVWTLGRLASWLACWIPGPVDWRGRKWHGPRLVATKSAGRH